MDSPDPIPISALQHWIHCPRQAALIHLERLWADNALTAQGHLLHATAHAPTSQRRKGVRTLTSVWLRSDELGVAGIADVVELHDAPRAHAFPIEYKRGAPKAHRADEVQLCAQALCLEEMLGVETPEGAIFYGARKRRFTVAFDEPLRALTRATARAVAAMLADGATPKPVFDPKRCDACSLAALCMPRIFDRPRNVERWLARALEV